MKFAFLVEGELLPRDVLEAQNPFLHFCGVFQVPMIYWIVVNELRLLGSPDNLFTPSFGQVRRLYQHPLQNTEYSPRFWPFSLFCRRSRRF
jgi:hypothetical protein